MEDSSQQPYQDSPVSTRPSSPSTPPTSSTAKPLPALPDAFPPPPSVPYVDLPPPNARVPILAAPIPQRHCVHHEAQIFFPPYTDSEDADDVPLAHLYPYPTEAPPSYNVAVQQSYRDTLISHIPTNPNISTEADEEEAVDREYHDDIRFKIERAVAALIVAFILLTITGVFVGFVITFKKGTGW